jgi:hypothetical protein
MHGMEQEDRRLQPENELSGSHDPGNRSRARALTPRRQRRLVAPSGGVRAEKCMCHVNPFHVSAPAERSCAAACAAVRVPARASDCIGTR